MIAPTDRTAEPTAVHAPAPPAGAETGPRPSAPVAAGPVSPTPAAGMGVPAAGPDPISRWGGEGGPDNPGKGGPPKPRKRRPKDIGTDAERAVVRYLQANGWPGAERRALRGQSDAGDITGTPGVAWEVKSRTRPVSDAQITEWLHETELERREARADIGVLVIRRPGVGPANAACWWTVMPLGRVVWLGTLALNRDVWEREISWSAHEDGQARLLLIDAVRLLRRAGYGDPLEDS